MTDDDHDLLERYAAEEGRMIRRGEPNGRPAVRLVVWRSKRRRPERAPGARRAPWRANSRPGPRHLGR